MKLHNSISWIGIAAIMLTTGCSINHPIAEDYGQYLSNNQGTAKFQRATVADKYYLPPETQNHRYEFRSALVGYANVWVVEFGKLLDETLTSRDVATALGSLTKANVDQINAGDTLVFNLQDYTFSDHAAHIALNISVKRNGTERFNKSFQATGLPQGGKMFWGGVFGMKNAVQQSTKAAIDTIISDFIKSISTELPDTAR